MKLILSDLHFNFVNHTRRPAAISLSLACKPIWEISSDNTLGLILFFFSLLFPKLL